MLFRSNVLLGNEQLNRREAKILAKYSENDEIIKLIQENWDNILDDRGVNQKLSLVLADALINPTGGWIRRKIKQDDMGYLDFYYDVMDSLSEVHPDPNFRKYDLDDCGYIVLDDWLTPEEILVKYGDRKFIEMGSWEDNVEGALFTPSDKEADEVYRKGNRYMVCTLEEKVSKPVYKIVIDNKHFKLTKKEISMLGDVDYNILGKDDQIRIKRTTVVPDTDEVIKKEMCPYPTERFSVFPCFSLDYNMTKSSQTSLISYLRSTQDRINKNESQKVDYIIQMLGKRTWISKYEKDAITKLQQTKGDPNAIIPLLDMNNAGKTDEDINIPPALFEETGMAKRFLTDISGINPAMEGYSERSGESGVLYDKKLGQGYTATNPFFENLAKTRELLAKDYVELIPFVFAEDNRLMKVQREGTLDYELVNVNYGGIVEKEIRNVEAKAILDEAENTPDRLQKTFEQNMALVNVLAGTGAEFGDIPWQFIIKHSNFRDKEEWIAFLKNRQRILQRAKERAMANEEAQSNVNIAQGMESMRQQPNMGGGE